MSVIYLPIRQAWWFRNFKAGEMAEIEYAASIKITKSVKNSILKTNERRERILHSKYEEVYYVKVNRSNQCALGNAQQKGASNWLTTLS